MKTPTPKIPCPAGFKAGGIHSGIKKKGKDLALIYSETPAAIAGVFTRNQLRAACVDITEKIVAGGIAQAIVINSGSANALTGKQGEHDVLETAKAVSQNLYVDVSKVAVASTGTIGKPLPLIKIVEGVEKLSKKISSEGLSAAAEAIMTTDTKIKFDSREIDIAGKKITISAIAKGAGMIRPDMATMLCFILTDLNASSAVLQKILTGSAQLSFNCVSVDGCTSTNDMALLMANGMAGNPELKPEGEDFEKVNSTIGEVTKRLAMMMARDGEGATKFIEIEVTGARSFESARKIGFAIADYNLLKCSFFGETLKSGRIMAAVGASGEQVFLAKVDVYLNEKLLIKSGELVCCHQDEISRSLKQNDIKLKVMLNMDEHNAVVWTCDFSPKYVKINMV